MRILLGNAVTIPALTIALVLVSAPARADFRDFRLDEGIVPGASNLEHTVDKINGAHALVITFDLAGSFAMSAYCDFGQYRANEGANLVLTQLNNIGRGRSGPGPGGSGYGLYAEFHVTGTFFEGELVGSTGTMTVWIDPFQDTTKTLPAFGGEDVVFGNRADDFPILQATDLSSATGIAANPGMFDLTFTLGPDGLTAEGKAYWPTLAGLTLNMTVDGDFDEFELTATQTVTGDLSVVFPPAEGIGPQLATLTLFGLASAGVGYGRWRRRS